MHNANYEQKTGSVSFSQDLLSQQDPQRNTSTQEENEATSRFSQSNTPTSEQRIKSHQPAYTPQTRAPKSR